jgi:hypothetical protein
MILMKRILQLVLVTIKTFKSKINNVSSIGGHSNNDERDLIVGSKAYARAFKNENGDVMTSEEMDNANADANKLVPTESDKYLCYDPLEIGEGCDEKGYKETNNYKFITSDSKLVTPFSEKENQDAKNDIKNCGTLLIFVKCGKQAKKIVNGKIQL